MSKHFDDFLLPLPCLKCGHKFEVSVARLKTSPDVSCPKCGVATRFEASQFRDGLAEADRALDDFAAELKKPFEI